MLTWTPHSWPTPGLIGQGNQSQTGRGLGLYAYMDPSFMPTPGLIGQGNQSQTGRGLGIICLHGPLIHGPPLA